jgi:lactoylglutathione lyase
MSHAEKAEGLANSIDKETDGYIFNHSMLRIKDPKRSLEFYSKVLGMRLVKKLDFPSMKFSLYFLGKHTDEEVKQIPTDSYERTVWTFRQKGLLELTHNWGAENDDAVKFHDGNSDPKGFGHIAFSVPDVHAACRRFEKHNITFVKKADDGSMKPLAFIKDPDGYWIEIMEAKATANIAKELGTI